MLYRSRKIRNTVYFCAIHPVIILLVCKKVADICTEFVMLELFCSHACAHTYFTCAHQCHSQVKFDFCIFISSFAFGTEADNTKKAAVTGGVTGIRRLARSHSSPPANATQSPSHCWPCLPSFTFLFSNPCGRRCLSCPLPAPSAAMYLMEEGSLRQAGAQALRHHYRALLHGRLFVRIDLVYGYIVCHWISLRADAKLIIIWENCLGK